MLLSFFQRLSKTQRSFLLRIALFYAAVLALFFLLNSTLLDPLSPNGSIGPEGMSSFPLLLIGGLLALFFFMNHSEVSTKRLAWPTAIQRTAATAGLLFVMICVWVFTHPSDESFSLLNQFIDRDPLVNTASVVTGLYALLLLPSLPLLFLFFPLGFLQKHAVALVFLGAVFLLYLFSAVPEAAYYHITGPRIVYAAQSLLNLLPGAMPAPDRWSLAYNGFTAEFGYSCSEFAALALFLGLFAFLCWRISLTRRVPVVPAVLTAIVGCVFIVALNILRIALVVIVASASPAIGLYLFHGAIGSILLCAFFVIYLRLMLPWMMKGTKKRVVDAPKAPTRKKPAPAKKAKKT